MRQFHVSKDIVTFLAWPITPGKLVSIYCHPVRMCIEIITLPHFLFSFRMKTMVSSVHYNAAMIILPSVFCKVGVNFSLFQIISNGLLSVKNFVIFTYTIKQYC